MRARTFYFDIDGTVLVQETGKCKPALADGQFERAIREALFDRIVCVGNLCNIVKLLKELGQDVDGRAMVYDVCDGAFSDLEWVKKNIELTDDPMSRGQIIDLNQSYFYADDLADYYLQLADRQELYNSEIGKRILQPEAASSGQELMAWLGWCARQD